MKKYTIEMAYGINVCVEDIEANSEEEAIEIAKQKVEDNTHEYADLSGLEYEMTTYVCGRE